MDTQRISIQITKVYAAYFSPTHTGERAALAVAQAMARQLGAQLERIDLTRPENRKKQYIFEENQALVLAGPVYGGRLPLPLEQAMANLKGKNTPAVALAVYGNRAYEDALVDGASLLERQGFLPIAAGAFIGEHSFSDTLAAGRPDEKDLELAALLGQKAAEKILSGRLDPPALPGNLPCKERGPAKEVFPKVREDCTRCGLCAQACPMGVIHGDDPAVADPGCIRCCACVKACPTGARFFDDPGMAQAKTWLETNFGQPKEVELFYQGKAQ